MFWLETDLEPDDILALYSLRHTNISHIVVGEGDAHIKFLRIKKYMELLPSLNPILIEGVGSDAKFEFDGKEFNSLDSTCENIHTDSYENNFKKFSQSQNPIMISLKPLRELMMYRDSLSPYLKNVTLYVYGGFNFRCIYSESNSQLDLINLLSMFKKVVIYESFYVSGTNNSIDKYTSPKIYSLLQDQNNEFFKTLMKLIKNWNIHILNKKKNALITATDEHEIKRIQKIINNVNDKIDFQLVLADFGLTAIFDKIEPEKVATMKFENGFTKLDFGESTSSNIYAYRNIPFETIEKMIIDKF